MTTALLTDRYELTMIEAALRSGRAHRRCVFEVFGRRLPGGRRFGVVAGTGRVLEAIADFRFGTPELDWLSNHRVVDDATLVDGPVDATTTTPIAVSVEPTVPAAVVQRAARTESPRHARAFRDFIARSPIALATTASVLAMLLAWIARPDTNESSPRISTTNALARATTPTPPAEPVPTVQADASQAATPAHRSLCGDVADAEAQDGGRERDRRRPHRRAL